MIITNPEDRSQFNATKQLADRSYYLFLASFPIGWYCVVLSTRQPEHRKYWRRMNHFLGLSTMAYALYCLYEHAKNERKMSLKYLDRYSLEQLKAMEKSATYISPELQQF